jgi:hypothetical protein
MNANPNIKDLEGLTPIDIANCLKKPKNILKILE